MGREGEPSRTSAQGDDRVQAAFLQHAVDALERLFGTAVSERLLLRVRGEALDLLLCSAVSTQNADGKYIGEIEGRSRAFQRRDASRSVPFEDAARLLLAVDAALGDGSGTVLERIGHELGARTLLAAEAGDSVFPPAADVATRARRLMSALVAPFPPDSIAWRIDDRSDGLEVLGHVPGYPATARTLRHLAAGQLRAAFTFAMEPTREDLRLVAESRAGDRFAIAARYRAPTIPPAAYTTPPSSLRPLGSGSHAAPAQFTSAQFTSAQPNSDPPPNYSLGSNPPPSNPPSAGALNNPPSSRTPKARPSVADYVDEILNRGGLGQRRNRLP